MTDRGRGVLPVINRKGDAMERLRSGCKINIFLRLLGRRPDGYHELFSLFLPLNAPFDEMIIRDGRKEGIHLSCDVPGIDAGNNTVTKAWRLYGEASGFAPALEVRLVKGVPHGAGLGGGSADAAEMLLYLERRSPFPLGRERLHSLAARIGADVPFFLEKEPCLVEGIGERLTPLPPESPWLAPLAGVWGVLLCPAVHVNTAWAYAAWDESHPGAASGGSSARGCGDALTDAAGTDKNHRSVFFPPLRVENDFESVVFTRWPELARLKALLLREGGFAAGMSGSGSSLFGLFRDAETARGFMARLRELDGSCVAYGPFSPLGPAE